MSRIPTASPVLLHLRGKHISVLDENIGDNQGVPQNISIYELGIPRRLSQLCGEEFLPQ